MKAYGIPRHIDIEFPDVASIQHYSMKSSIGSLISKSGEYGFYTRPAKSRRSTRLYWKRGRGVIKLKRRCIMKLMVKIDGFRK